MAQTVTETQAILETISAVKSFHKEFGENALIAALNNGAFKTHRDFGEVHDIIIFRDTKVEIPDWISKLFEEYGN